MSGRNPEIQPEVTNSFAPAEQQLGEGQKQANLSALDILKSQRTNADQGGSGGACGAKASSDLERLGFAGHGQFFAAADAPDQGKDAGKDKVADKKEPGKDNNKDKAGGGPAADRVTLDLGQVKDMVKPTGFNQVDQKKVDEEFDAANSSNKVKVLQHQDKDKQDAKLTVTKFGYFDQPDDVVKGFNDFLNSIKKEDLGKPITLTDKQMDQVYSALPNGLDSRPQTDHTFRVEEINGRRVLITENKVQGPDGNAKDEKMKLTVYANPDGKKQTMDVISFEASNQDKAKKGDNNYATLMPDVLKSIRSINWVAPPSK